MSRFRYVHHDGRIGLGNCTWSAICAAIGPDEAGNLPECESLRWDHCGILRKFLPKAERDGHRRADYISRETGERLGTLIELQN